MVRAASSDGPHAEVERLFMAAHRHLGKVDPAIRACVIENAASVLSSGEPGALDDLSRFLASLDIPEGTRGSFMGTIENAARLAREIRRSAAQPYTAPSPDARLDPAVSSPLRQSRRARLENGVF